MAREKRRAESEFTDELMRVLGARRSARLRRVMRQTGLPPEPLIDLAIEIIDIASRKMILTPIQHEAIGLASARWRNVSPADRSDALRKAVQARWAKKKEADAQKSED